MEMEFFILKLNMTQNPKYYWIFNDLMSYAARKNDYN